MVTLLFVLFVILMVISIVLVNRNYCWEPGVAIGGIGAFICLIALVANLYNVVHLSVLDDEIAMYQEENAQIESDLADCVEHYMAHEKAIFTEVDPESALTLVALYPELKSDILVSYLMETYTTNTEQIKTLRSEYIRGDTARWWLYFGGNGVPW